MTSLQRFANQWCLVAVLFTYLFAPQVSFAQSLNTSGLTVPKIAELKSDDEYVTLSADFDFALPPPLEDALARGVALYFVLEIEVTRQRIFLLFDETIASKSEVFRLAYVPLTKSWRLTSGLYTQNLTTIEAAMRQFSRLRAIKVIDKKLLQKGERYTVIARLRHDINQLPKPLQVGALATRDWTLDIEPVKLSLLP